MTRLTPAATNPTGSSSRRKLIPRGVQRDDFAVGRKAPKADQHSDEHGHGQRERQHRRERAEKKQRDRPDAARMADDQIHQAHKLRNEENKCEDSEAKDGVRAQLRGQYIDRAGA